MAQVCYGYYKDTKLDNIGKAKEEWSDSPLRTPPDEYRDKPLKALINWMVSWSTTRM